MAAHDDQADGKRDGEDQAHRSPDKRPESCGDKDGKGGEAGVASVDVWLKVVAGDDFKESEAGGDEDGVFPSMKDRDGKKDGSDGGDRNSDVGDEAANGGESAEEDWMGKPDEIEDCGDEDSETGVDGDLKNEVTGDAAAGVAHSLRHE